MIAQTNHRGQSEDGDNTMHRVWTPWCTHRTRMRLRVWRNKSCVPRCIFTPYLSLSHIHLSLSISVCRCFDVCIYSRCLCIKPIICLCIFFILMDLRWSTFSIRSTHQWIYSVYPLYPPLYILPPITFWHIFLSLLYSTFHDVLPAYPTNQIYLVYPIYIAAHLSINRRPIWFHLI